MTLLLLSVAAAMVIPFFRAGITKSTAILAKYRATEQLGGVMADINREYYNSAKNAAALTTLNSDIANKIHGANVALGGTNYAAYTTSTSFAKIQASDVNNALIVTVTDTVTNQTLTNVFTVQN